MAFLTTVFGVAAAYIMGLDALERHQGRARMSGKPSLYHDIAQIKRDKKEIFNKKVSQFKESAAGHMVMCDRLASVGVDKCPTNYNDAIQLAVQKGVLSARSEKLAHSGRGKGNEARHDF
jgi:hypothetical protein